MKYLLLFSKEYTLLLLLSLMFHDNTLMKFFNTADKRLEGKGDNLTTDAVLKKEMADLKSSMQSKISLKLTQKYHKSTLLMMKILKR